MSRSEYRGEDAITIAVTPADDPPPSKRPRGPITDVQAGSRPAGKIFFKTKLCGRFRAGTCNFTNCSFAHGVEELRRPPGNWQEEDRALRGWFGLEDQGRERESVAITVGAGGGGQKPSNWKTRICNKWETTGFCPFGSKCHFAHGSAELHKYGGGMMEPERREPSGMVPVAMAQTEPPAAPPVSEQRQVPREVERWRGPGKINKIYGDWIDDNG